MSAEGFSKGLDGYSTTRRALLKTAALSAATGVVAPLIELDGKAEPASIQAGKRQAIRREQATSAGGLSRARLARMRDVMAGYVDSGELPGIVIS